MSVASPAPAASIRSRKLYLPYGGLPRGLRVRRGLPGECGLVFHWFRVGRAEPIAPYESLILGYAGLAPAARARAEAMVDEMLTEEEFGQLRDYLFRKHGEDTRTAVLTAPLPSLKVEGVTRAAAQRPYLPPAAVGESAESSPDPHALSEDELCASGFYRLSAEEGCPLPFEVWGYFAPATPRSLAAAALHAAGDE